MTDEDTFIGVALTPDESRALLVCALAALQGQVADLSKDNLAMAANAAAARLKNRMTLCAMDSAQCADARTKP